MIKKRFFQAIGLFLLALSITPYQQLEAKKKQKDSTETSDKKRKKKNKKSKKQKKMKHHDHKKYAGIHKITLLSGEIDDTIKQLEAAVSSNKRVIVKFYAWWCSLCNNMEDIDMQTIRYFKGDDVTLVKVQVGGMQDKSNEDFKTAEFEKIFGNIRGVPKYLFIADGNIKNAHEQYGTMTFEQMRDLVNTHILKK